jgi:hypothetical protein
VFSCFSDRRHAGKHFVYRPEEDDDEREGEDDVQPAGDGDNFFATPEPLEGRQGCAVDQRDQQQKSERENEPDGQHACADEIPEALALLGFE